MDKPHILIIGHGGTISMAPSTSGSLAPRFGAKELIAQIPKIGQMARFKVIQLTNRDSSELNPSDWTKLAITIARHQDEYDGILVPHGTDTMAYSAGAVSLALGPNLRIPVVFTGSQLPFRSTGSDAHFNVENGVKAVVRAHAEKVAEVMVSFSANVLRGSRASKRSESDFDAFHSPGMPPLAHIDASHLWDFSHKDWRLPAFSLLSRKRPRKKASDDVKPHFNGEVISIGIAPGLPPELLGAMIDSGKCRALILRSLGSGNMPSLDARYSLIPTIQKATRAKIPVLVSTQFVGGRTRMNMYESGRRALDAGAIPTGDLTAEMAQVKVSWLIAQGYVTPSQLRKMILHNFVGEVTPE